ncbi:MAG: tryptophan synthase subunit alpha [Planctomycetota bacterium]|nr:MAG: tryptophan synthase subunit alpha [Planctomycetota bacterium]
MSRIEAAFAGLKERGHGGLMPFVCAGAPTLDALTEVLPALSDAGAVVIEVGIPFSDPIADGPVIAAAMHDAIGRGITPTKVFDQVRAVRDRVSSGLVAMVSVSLVHAMGGGAAFCERARGAGFDGCIFPDAPLEESEELGAACRDHGLTCSLLIAPTTPKDRARLIAERCTGFVYLLARAGITGERSEAPEVADRVRMLRRVTALPIACGFGISTPDHVRAVVEHADAAIVGTALVRRLEQAGNGSLRRVCEDFLAELSTGLVSLG